MGKLLLIILLGLSTSSYSRSIKEMKQLDSLNLTPANIRINQLGYHVDGAKKAFVNAYETYKPTDGMDFHLISSDDGSIVYSSKLTDTGIDYLRGSFSIKG